jgi:metallophosphoesterase (TIGR00282 family)
MRVLFIGDIVAAIGREATKKVLPQIKAEEKIDFTIANGEHLSNRVGLNVTNVKEMEEAGIDFFTTGNHVWRQKGFSEEIGREDVPVIRPANMPKSTPGQGHRIESTPKGRILIINLLGREGIQAQVSSPFEKIDELLSEIPKEDYDYSFVDFHAEMSSEKVALGRYLDGRVSAVVGTHTHVPTADERVLKKSTAYIGDVGFVGPRESVLGVKDEIIFDLFTTGMPQKFEVAAGECQFNSVVIELDETTRFAKSIKRLDKVVNVE